MDINSLSRVSDSLHRIEDMARIGWLEPQKIDVYVYTDDPGQIPHIHIRTYRKGSQPKKGDIDCCVMLEEARYFNHGSHKGELSSSMRKKLNNFMHSIDVDDGITYYELACKEWNRNNSDVRVCVKDELSSYLRKKLNDFMHSTHKRWETTYYEVACEYWNENNSDVEVKVKKDEEGNVIIPDYSKIELYK